MVAEFKKGSSVDLAVFSLETEKTSKLLEKLQNL